MTLVRRGKRRKKDWYRFTILLKEDVIRYLYLYCLAMGETRSFTVRELVDDWYHTTKEEWPADVLFERIVDAIERQWKISQTGKSKATPRYDNFDQFLDQLESELSKSYSKVDPVTTKALIHRLDEKNRQGEYED